MAVLEILATATDQASDVISNIGRQGSQAANKLQANWGKVAIATGAAGAAMEGIARKVAPLNQSIRNLADSTDMTEKEVRGLAASMVDATFPAEEVTALMERGRQQGLKTGPELKRYAEFWDMVGDATGESSDRLADAGVALRAVGIQAGEESQVLGALGMITRETNMEVSDFLRSVERLAPEMSALNMTVDDSAAIFAALEAKGLTSRTAMQEFRRAATGADGDMGALLETLGLTSEEFEKYQQKVKESGDVLQQMAARHAEGKTEMQGMWAWVGKMTLAYGDQLEAVGKLVPALLGFAAVVPIIGGLKKVAIGLKVALYAIAAAGAVAIAAVLSLAVAAILLWKNWDTVIDFWADKWLLLFDILDETTDKIKIMWSNLWAGAKDDIAVAWEGIVNIVKNSVNYVIDYINRMITAIEKVINAASAVAGKVGVNIPGVNLGRVPKLHSGGLFRAPNPGGEGLAILRDGERVVTPEKAGMGGNQVVVNQSGLFAGANIRMTSPEDAKTMAEEIYALTRSRLRAEGITI